MPPLANCTYIRFGDTLLILPVVRRNELGVFFLAVRTEKLRVCPKWRRVVRVHTGGEASR